MASGLSRPPWPNTNPQIIVGDYASCDNFENPENIEKITRHLKAICGSDLEALGPAAWFTGTGLI